MRPQAFVRRCIAALFLLLAAGAWAQAGTLDKIKRTGAISLGHREASIPFSYLGDNRQPAGYSVELCQRVAESVRRQLGLADLQVKWVPVTPGNRVEKLNSGEIDLECGSTTNTLSRQEQVSFSLLTFADGGSLLMRPTRDCWASPTWAASASAWCPAPPRRAACRMRWRDTM